jgi:hypothetical protein
MRERRVKNCLTPEQAALKAKIGELIGQIKVKQAELRDMSRACVDMCTEHVFRPLTKKELADKWMSEDAICLVCGLNFGWRCKVSPTGHCTYEKEDEYGNDPCCDHCGLPDERK